MISDSWQFLLYLQGEQCVKHRFVKCLVWLFSSNFRFKWKKLSKNYQISEIVEVKDEDEKNQDTDEYMEEFACEFCDQTFTNSTDLLSHRDSHAELNEEHAKYIEDST